MRLESCRHRKVRRLSAGQRRRVALACLRLKPARLWLLDEPLTNLDARGTEVVIDWLKGHAVEGGVAVVSTHRAATVGNRGIHRSGTLMLDVVLHILRRDLRLAFRRWSELATPLIFLRYHRVLVSAGRRLPTRPSSGVSAPR